MTFLAAGNVLSKEEMWAGNKGLRDQGHTEADK